jgi:hypothetical protein
MKPRDYARWIAENILKESSNKKLNGGKAKEDEEEMEEGAEQEGSQD